MFAKHKVTKTQSYKIRTAGIVKTVSGGYSSRVANTNSKTFSVDGMISWRQEKVFSRVSEKSISPGYGRRQSYTDHRKKPGRME